MRQPIFNVPGTVVALLALFIAVHVAGMFLSEPDLVYALLALAFIPARYTGLAAELPGGDAAAVTSIVTHMVVHADAMHLAINSAWMLAFGSILCRRFGSARFLLFSVLGGIAGAALFFALHPQLLAPVVGASGAISAMMGGVMRFLFNAIDAQAGDRLRADPRSIPAASLSETLRHSRIMVTSGIFLAVNLLAILGFGAFGSGAAIAWEAHLGGYVFGLLAFGLFDTAPQYSSPTPSNGE